jgi:HSP20 family protein
LTYWQADLPFIIERQKVVFKTETVVYMDWFEKTIITETIIKIKDRTLNMNRNYRFGSPFFGQDDSDQRVENTLPWKIIKAFSPEEETSFQPSLDIKSGERDYVIYAEIPGINKDKVKLEIHDRTLLLSGEKTEEMKEDEVKHVGERLFGAFERKIALPDDADLDNISAKHKDGLLIITIAKLVPKVTNKSITIS